MRASSAPTCHGRACVDTPTQSSIKPSSSELPTLIRLFGARSLLDIWTAELPTLEQLYQVCGAAFTHSGIRLVDPHPERTARDLDVAGPEALKGAAIV
jgi:hypothetical protein